MRLAALFRGPLPKDDFKIRVHREARILKSSLDDDCGLLAPK
jgi:hypothetical protein